MRIFSSEQMKSGYRKLLRLIWYAMIYRESERLHTALNAEKSFSEKPTAKDVNIGTAEIPIALNMIIGAVLTVLNTAIANPSLLEYGGEISVYSPTVDVIRQQNEINRMTDSAQIDFDRVKAEIFRLAELKYDCCTYNDSPQKTAEIKALLENHEQLNTLDIGLFKSCVNRILISHFCTIEVELINGTRIQNISERNENCVNRIECNDNSCESSDGNKP